MDTRTKKVWYSAEESNQRHEVRIPHIYNITRPLEQRDIAELCAADYHAEHDGSESNWPLDFDLYESEDGPLVARLVVERDFEPQFMARHVQPNA